MDCVVVGRFEFMVMFCYGLCYCCFVFYLDFMSLFLLCSLCLLYSCFLSHYSLFALVMLTVACVLLVLFVCFFLPLPLPSSLSLTSFLFFTLCFVVSFASCLFVSSRCRVFCCFFLCCLFHSPYFFFKSTRSPSIYPLFLHHALPFLPPPT